MAIIVTAVLAIIKMAGGIITGSVGLRADAVHSLVDLSGAVIGLVGIKIASKPPDKGHAFGHGKAENMAGAIIGLFILGAAFFIAYEAIIRIIHGSVVEMVAIGIYITAFAIVLNLAMSWYGLKVARASESIALEATSRDLLADSMSSIAVLIGLLAVAVTGNYIFDSVIALVVSVVILRTALKTIIKSAGGLMDRRLPDHEEEVIRQCIENHGVIIDFYKLRTRKAGGERHIDVNIVLPGSYSLEKAHAVSEELEKEISKKLPRSRVMIHIEPHQEV